MPNAAHPPTRGRLAAMLAIDAHDLEGERRTQHDKFYTVSRELALAISRRDAVKKQIKELDARLSETIRNGWNSDDGRLTEKICADRALLDPEMVDLTDELLEQEGEVGLWFALKDAYEQRNAALEGLIKLYLSEHYGESRLAQAEENRTAIAEQRRHRVRNGRR